MIGLPEGWRRLATVGDDIAASPDGLTQLRYRSRLTPLQKFATLVDATLAERAEWTESARGARARFYTGEGEHAFGMALEGTWDGMPAQRYVGVVYGDDAYSVVDAVSLATGMRLEPLAREWTRSVSLLLGLRRRRYFYARPEGWHGHASGMVTHWFPALYPARATTLICYPANPTREVPTTVYDALVAHEQAQGARIEPLGEPSTIVGRHGLPGLHWRMLCTTSDREAHRDLVVFARAPYTYAVQLDSLTAPDPEARELLRTIAATVEPVPDGRNVPAAGGEPGAFDFL